MSRTALVDDVLDSAGKQRANLERRNEVCRFQQSQLTDLVYDAGYLGVRGAGFGGLPSPGLSGASEVRRSEC